MVYLHENTKDFINAINVASKNNNILPDVVEKDYYVTIILRLLAEKLPFIVFKGGTSLSKCYRLIKRFSEDIDITIDQKISQKQMKELKETIKDIAITLGLSIPNIEETRSRRNYNKYILQYTSVINNQNNIIKSSALVETSFSEVSFPTVVLPVNCYIGDLLINNSLEIAQSFKLDPFNMMVQSINRTFIDKVFALCDYYLENKATKYSRHIYDIYKLLPLVSLDDNLRLLINEVRIVRSKTKICPSASSNISISNLLAQIISGKFFENDYNNLTQKILQEPIKYETAIQALITIKESNIFG